MIVPRYSEERKHAVLSKLLPPLNMTVAEVSRVEGIGLQTLYNWRDEAKLRGHPVPGNKPTPDQWSAEAKLAVVIETSSLNEAELIEYCRERGLFVEQVKAWKADSLKGFASSREQELNLRIKPKRRLRRDKPDALSVPTAMNQVRKSPPHKFFFAYLNSRFAALLGFTGVCYSAFVLQPTRPLG